MNHSDPHIHHRSCTGSHHRHVTRGFFFQSERQNKYVMNWIILPNVSLTLTIQHTNIRKIHTFFHCRTFQQKSSSPSFPISSGRQNETGSWSSTVTLSIDPRNPGLSGEWPIRILAEVTWPPKRACSGSPKSKTIIVSMCKNSECNWDPKMAC